MIAALPEAFIGIIAALNGYSNLAAGTLLGANIADLTLILGLVALAGNSIRIKSSIVKKDLYFVGLVMLPIILGMNGVVSRIDGVILIGAGVLFIYTLLREREHFTKPYKDGNAIVKHTGILFACMVAMLISAYYIVQSAHGIAIGLGMPELLIGLILVALGTTLPEFIFSLNSVRKGHPDLAIGDILGNVVVDACILMGVIALISPIYVDLFLWSIIGVFTAFAIIFSLLFMRTDGVLTKDEAMALILFYVAFVVVQILLR